MECIAHPMMKLSPFWPAHNALLNNSNWHASIMIRLCLHTFIKPYKTNLFKKKINQSAILQHLGKKIETSCLIHRPVACCSLTQRVALFLHPSSLFDRCASSNKRKIHIPVSVATFSRLLFTPSSVCANKKPQNWTS